MHVRELIGQCDADVFSVIPSQLSSHNFLWNLDPPSVMVTGRLRDVVSVPCRYLNHDLAWLLNHGLASQTRVELQIGSHVEAVRLVVVHLTEKLFALLHHDVTSGASAVSAASVLQMQAKIHSHVQDRLWLAMLLIRQLAMLKFKALVLGEECYANRTWP